MEITTIKIGRAADAMSVALNTPDMRVYYRSAACGLVLIKNLYGQKQSKAFQGISMMTFEGVVASRDGVSQIGSKVTVHVPPSGEVCIVHGGSHPEDDLMSFEPYAIPAQNARYYDMESVAVYYAGHYGNFQVEHLSTKDGYTRVRALDGSGQIYAMYEPTELVVAPVEEVGNA